jgi:single-stranded DNA-binding protein
MELNDLNSMLIEGEMARDPRLITMPGGGKVCNFAVSARHRPPGAGEMEAGCYEAQAYGRLAEAIFSQAAKGRRIRVCGWLRALGDLGPIGGRCCIAAEHFELVEAAGGAG